MLDQSNESHFSERFGSILFVSSIMTIVALFILIIYTTDPIQDLLFFVTQVNIDSLLIDFTVILFGLVAFLYYFILPGLPWLLTRNPFGISLNPRVLLIVSMYSGVGNYIGLLIGMLIGIPIFGLISPLILVLFSIVFNLVRGIQSLPKETPIQSPLEFCRYLWNYCICRLAHYSFYYVQC